MIQCFSKLDSSVQGDLLDCEADHSLRCVNRPSRKARAWLLPGTNYSHTTLLGRLFFQSRSVTRSNVQIPCTIGLVKKSDHVYDLLSRRHNTEKVLRSHSPVFKRMAFDVGMRQPSGGIGSRDVPLRTYRADR